MAKFHSQHETCVVFDSNWKLCLQYGAFDDDLNNPGYRFIWRDHNNAAQPYKGQSKIPSLSIARLLMEKADREGWGNYFNSNATINGEPF